MQGRKNIKLLNVWNLHSINPDLSIDLLTFSIPYERNEKCTVESNITAKHLVFCIFNLFGWQDIATVSSMTVTVFHRPIKIQTQHRPSHFY